jgi:hypothetical protein
MPPPPKTDVPKPRKLLSSKLGISDKFAPMSEFEKPEFPKSEPKNPELPKRDLPKFDIERPEENDENDENRDDSRIFVENRFEPNPWRGAYVFDTPARPSLDDENPETFPPKEAFLEFPNECHWPPTRTLLR